MFGSIEGILSLESKTVKSTQRRLKLFNDCLRGLKHVSIFDLEWL